MMETKYWQVDADANGSGLSEAAAVLAAGGIVAFPTETVYGLGADARNSAAVAGIFAAKGRPADNPLIVHLASEQEMDTLVAHVNDIERRLIHAFWPGPLTLVLPVKSGTVSPLVTAGLDTVAVRVPAHDLARQLIAYSECPLAAPSANRSSRPSPTEASHVLEDLAGRIDGVLDGGPTGIGLESTVVRVLGGSIHILRPGGVTCEQLQAVAGPEVRVVDSGSESKVEVGVEAGPTLAVDAEGRASDMSGADRGNGETRLAQSGGTSFDSGQETKSTVANLSAEADRPRSPGVKYKHYAPQGAMQLIVGADPDRIVAAVREAAAEARLAGSRKIGILASSEHADRYADIADQVLVCGSRQAPAEAARRLYAALRECDRLGLDVIVAEGFPEDGIGAALMNRMRKAAGGRVYEV